MESTLAMVMVVAGLALVVVSWFLPGPDEVSRRLFSDGDAGRKRAIR